MSVPAVPDIATEDVPPRWREIVRFAKFAIWILASGGMALGIVHLEAARVVHDSWSKEQRAEVISLAAEAAKQGARDAMLEGMTTLVRPLQDRLQTVALDIAEHRKEDDQRVLDLTRRVQRAEDRLDALPAERRRPRVVAGP